MKLGNILKKGFKTIMKTPLIIFCFYALFGTGPAFGLTCKENNSVELPIDSHCCCAKVATTVNDNKNYKCTVTKATCTSSETEIGMKNASGLKICPCSLTLKQ